LLVLFYGVTGWGHEAVIAFFLLSGYLVGGGLIEAGLGRASLCSYFIHRVSRIYAVLAPALLLTLVLDLAGEQLAPALYRRADWSSSLDYAVTGRQSLSVLACNLVNLQDAYCPTFGSNGPLWSLAYEWFYYLSFPFLISACHWLRSRPLRPQRWILCIGGAGLLTLLFPNYVSYYPIWLLGVIARRAGGRLRISRGCIVAALAALVALRVGARTHIGPIWVWDYLMAAALTTLLLQPASFPACPRFERICRAMAGFSYSLYLIHFPVLVSITAVLLRLGSIDGRSPPSLKVFGLFAGCLLTIYCAAWLVALVTEHQTARLRRVLARHARRWITD
jgi:peptidoglycan/LPS O-acetylase OafA/YrhL